MVTRGSSSTMLPMPWPSAMVALAAALRLTKKVSLGSPTRSPLASTVTVLTVWSGSKVNTLDEAW
jgi:hypothetical protein